MENIQNPGYLIVNVSTARGAIPLADASVTVFDSDAPENPIVTSVVTDNSGKTPRIALPAPDRDISMRPGNEKPYASYLIEVEKEGYYPVTNSGVPVFSGITSIQPVEMLPLSDHNSENIYPRFGLDIPESENPNLRGE